MAVAKWAGADESLNKQYGCSSSVRRCSSERRPSPLHNVESFTFGKCHTTETVERSAACMVLHSRQISHLSLIRISGKHRAILSNWTDTPTLFGISYGDNSYVTACILMQQWWCCCPRDHKKTLWHPVSAGRCTHLHALAGQNNHHHLHDHSQTP